MKISDYLKMPEGDTILEAFSVSQERGDEIIAMMREKRSGMLEKILDLAQGTPKTDEGMSKLQNSLQKSIANNWMFIASAFSDVEVNNFGEYLFVIHVGLQMHSEIALTLVNSGMAKASTELAALQLAMAEKQKKEFMSDEFDEK